MKHDLQLSVVFCEDYRVEEGGKPILLGLLPPVGYVDWDEQLDDHIYVLCTVTSPPDVTEIKLELVLKIDTTDEEPTSKRLKKTVRFQEDFEKGEPWISWLPLPIKVPTDPRGTRIMAELSANKRHAWAMFAVKPLAELRDKAVDETKIAQS